MLTPNNVEDEHATIPYSNDHEQNDQNEHEIMKIANIELPTKSF